MGEVYRATDTKLGREVAIKVLPPEMAASPDRLDRFRREAKALAALDHPGIVTVHSVEEAGGVHFLTMQLVEGRPLTDVISKGGLPPERILSIATGLADALAVAHERGVVHRDLKPANVMLRDDGSVKVLDFGLAKMTGPEAEEALGSDVSTQARTREGAVMGTLPYMAPEQISGRPVDHRSDIFSLGVLLYEMATGRRPFEGQSSAELGSAILRDTPPPPSELRGDLREALSRVIARCLEKDPDSRFQSVRALLGALREAAAVGGGSGATGTERPAPRAVKLAGGITVVLAAVAVLFLFLRGEDPREGTAVRTPEVDTSTAGAAARPSVAVLPFANLSGDPAAECRPRARGQRAQVRLASAHHGAARQRE
jgi:serine/threonine protein kinase